MLGIAVWYKTFHLQQFAVLGFAPWAAYETAMRIGLAALCGALKENTVVHEQLEPKCLGREVT